MFPMYSDHNVQSIYHCDILPRRSIKFHKISELKLRFVSFLVSLSLRSLKKSQFFKVIFVDRKSLPCFWEIRDEGETIDLLFCEIKKIFDHLMYLGGVYWMKSNEVKC